VLLSHVACVILLFSCSECVQSNIIQPNMLVALSLLLLCVLSGSWSAEYIFGR
jgi:hypothetical protein